MVFLNIIFQIWITTTSLQFFNKKDIIKEINYYSTNYKIAGDFEFLIKLFKKTNIKFKYMNINSIYQSVGGISDTPIMKKKRSLERYVRY